MSPTCKIELVLVSGTDRQILSSVELPSSDDMKVGLELANMTAEEWFSKAIGGVIEVAQHHAVADELPSISGNR